MGLLEPALAQVVVLLQVAGFYEDSRLGFEPET
jgi:hypothetical protein